MQVRSNRRSVFPFFLLALGCLLAITAGCAGDADIPVAAQTGDATSIPITPQPVSGSATAAATAAPSPSGAPSPTARVPAETSIAVATLASPTAIISPIASTGGRLGPGLHDFTLPDAQGGQVTLSQYLGEKTVVLAFYRAWW